MPTLMHAMTRNRASLGTTPVPTGSDAAGTLDPCADVVAERFPGAGCGPYALR